jgi:hypothetical protein
MEDIILFNELDIINSLDDNKDFIIISRDGLNGIFTEYRISVSNLLLTDIKIYEKFGLIQVIESNQNIAVSDNVRWVIFNPNTIQNSFILTSPFNPKDSDILQISFGGTITSGTVVKSFTFAPNTGQSVLQPTTPTLVEAGETITYRFYNSKWYRL